MIVFNNKLHLISFLHKIVKYIIGINSSGIEIWKTSRTIITIIDVKGPSAINVQLLLKTIIIIFFWNNMSTTLGSIFLMIDQVVEIQAKCNVRLNKSYSPRLISKERWKNIHIYCNVCAYENIYAICIVLIFSNCR